MEDSILNDPNITRIQLPRKTIPRVGTAHISQQSVDLAESVIRALKPDSVAVELCDARLQSLKNPDRWKNTNILKVIKDGKSYVLLAQLMLAAFQKRLGSQVNIKPGAEMLKAYSVAEEIGSKGVAVDREVSITLKRCWASLSVRDAIKLIYTLVRGLLQKTEVSAEEIERLKTNDALESLMSDFSKALPGVRKALIDERDLYLAHEIKNSPGQNIVAVIGAAHVPGIIKVIENDYSIEELKVTPKKKLLTKIIGYSIPAIFIISLIYGFVVMGSGTSFAMLKAWFWITGCCGALGAALAGGHPITVILAFIAAPFASLHPLIAAGWVAGLVEASVRQPRVSDLENITTDISTVSGAYRNRVSRALLVVAFTNLFVLAGMVIGTQQVIEIAAEVKEAGDK